MTTTTTRTWGWVLKFTANRTHWTNTLLSQHGDITGPTAPWPVSFQLSEKFATKAEADARLSELCVAGITELSSTWRMTRGMV